jgi:colanic acid/amylovoran biosynthesis glycosyltransferase
MARAPRVARQYWRVVRSRFGWQGVKRFYLDAPLIALAPDILHFEFGALAVGREYLKRALGCRLSASFRGYDVSYAGLENPDYYARLWEDADAFHVLGRDLWRRALRRGCPPDKPHAIIPPAIDVDYFIPDLAARPPKAITADRPLRILSVGRLEWVKGYDYGLSALRLLAERGVPFEHHVIGDGEYLEPLAFACHELGLTERVRFLGGRPHPVVIVEMNWADVFLHASVSEGFCNAVLEAQAMQLPVVASDADGLAENVEDGRTGFIVPRRDPAALADRLAQLAADDRLRREMGAAGRRRVEECFILPQQIAAFDRFYRQLGAGHAR